MIGTIIAAIVGREIDEQDGEGGALGAVAGVVGWKAAKTLVPLALLGTAILIGSRYMKAAAERY